MFQSNIPGLTDKMAASSGKIRVFKYLYLRRLVVVEVIGLRSQVVQMQMKVPFKFDVTWGYTYYGYVMALKCKWHENFYCPIWKSLKNQEHCRLPFLNIFSRSKVTKVWRWGKWSKKWCRGLGKNQSKLIKSVTSCGGHLARVDLSMYYSSANTC